MSFLDQIIANRNEYINDLHYCLKNRYKIYIWGTGRGAKHVLNRLLKDNIHIEGFAVNKKYYNGDTLSFYDKEYKVVTIEEASSYNEKIALIVSFSGYNQEMFINIDKHFLIIYRDVFEGNEVTTSEDMTYEWVVENENNIARLFETVEDDYSRQTLVAYINQKISHDWKYLKEFKQDKLYFDDTIYDLKNNEVLVDCGAFRGGCARGFADLITKKGMVYEAIYSFEPDDNNYSYLLNNQVEKQYCYKKGVGSKKKIVCFGGENAGATISSSGDRNIEIDTIDNILAGEKATIIKMDIEGAELEALHGAKATIKKYHPVLAISIYHKHEDLWEILDYIKNIDKSYKFYVRACAFSATELVLYAVYKK